MYSVYYSQCCILYPVTCKLYSSMKSGKRSAYPDRAHGMRREEKRRRKSWDASRGRSVAPEFPHRERRVLEAYARYPPQMHLHRIHASVRKFNTVPGHHLFFPMNSRIRRSVFDPIRTRRGPELRSSYWDTEISRFINATWKIRYGTAVQLYLQIARRN